MQKDYNIYPVVEMSPARTELGGPIMAAAYENKLIDTPARRKALALEIFRQTCPFHSKLRQFFQFIPHIMPVNTD